MIAAAVAASLVLATMVRPVQPAPARRSPPSIEVTGDVRLGVHQRKVLPLSPDAAVQLSPSAAAATRLTLRGPLPKHRRIYWSGVVSYRSGLGMRATIDAPGRVARRPRARSQDAVVAVGGEFALRSQGTQILLGTLLGYGARAFHLEAQLGLPGYVLHGPRLAPTLGVIVRDGLLRVDGQLHVGAGPVTRARHLRPDRSLALVAGGEIRAQLRIYRTLHLAVGYAEYSGWIVGAPRDRDAARWATAGVAVHR